LSIVESVALVVTNQVLGMSVVGLPNSTP